MPRANPQPLGRADHKQRVAAAQQSIDEVLQRLTADPDPRVRAWAEPLLDDKPEPPTAAKTSST